MNVLKIVLILGTGLLSQAGCYAAEVLDPAQFIRQRGWRPVEGHIQAHSPSQDIAPMLYYEKGNSVPSCGLIAVSPNEKDPTFFELVSSDPGADYPQCMGVISMVPFRLQNRDYIAVEYESRDTREDFYRSFHYVYRDAAMGYLRDKTLTAVVPSNAPASKHMDGVKIARAAHLAKAFPQWRLLDRDFISDTSSSFAILEDKKKQRCHFVAEAGGAPVMAHHEEFVPDTKCVSVLASSRIEKAGTLYYLVMFKSDKGKQLVAVTSVSPAGKVTAEKALSDRVNRSGATKDIRTAKASLSNMLP